MATPALTRGDRAPNFQLYDPHGTLISLYSRALGGPLVVVFLPTLDEPAPLTVLDGLQAAWPELAAAGAELFCVATASEDAVAARASLQKPDFPLVADPGGETASRYGVAGRLTAFVLDSRQRVLARFDGDAVTLVSRAVASACGSPRTEPYKARPHAPVLRVPNILDPDICAGLVAAAAADPEQPNALIPLQDAAQLNQTAETIGRRVLPEIRRAFQAAMSRVEGVWIGAQESSPEPPEPHRQNDSRATRFRRFSMELELDDGSFEGGEICFPEYGGALYRLRTGEAIVYSSGLLRAVLPVRTGVRWSLVSHFYDEEGERVRQEIRREAMSSGGAA